MKTINRIINTIVNMILFIIHDMSNSNHKMVWTKYLSQNKEGILCLHRIIRKNRNRKINIITQLKSYKIIEKRGIAMDEKINVFKDVYDGKIPARVPINVSLGFCELFYVSIEFLPYFVRDI